jgi:hypothetical protein
MELIHLNLKKDDSKIPQEIFEKSKSFDINKNKAKKEDKKGCC